MMTLLRWIGKQPLVRAIATRLATLMEAGTAPYPEDVRRRLKIVNCVAYLIAFFTAGYVIQYSIADYDKFRLLIWLNAALTLLAIAVPYAHRFSDIAGGLIIVVVEYIALFAITMLLGRESGAHLHYFIAPAAAFVVFGLNRSLLVLATVAVGVILLITAHFAFPAHKAWIAVNDETINPVFTQTVVTIAGLIAASVWYAFSLAEKAKAETDVLLHNILPDSVVARLKHDPDRLIADAHTSVSVIFTDISGFVALSLAMGPEKVVGLLNEIVRDFDGLAKKHGVEKIKTIGDAYMAVAGVPEPNAKHARATVLLAMEMLETVDRIRHENEIDLSIRVGVASGPVMAGVIGTNKFSYDVWGDTVNLASRLEGASERGRILVCEKTYAALRSEFAFEAAGDINIKGQGAKAAWFVTGFTSDKV
jgi:adenylate cyclase